MIGCMILDRYLTINGNLVSIMEHTITTQNVHKA